MRLIDWWIPSDLYTNPARLVSARVGVVATAAIGLVELARAWNYWSLDAPWPLPLALLGGACFALSVPIIIKLGRSGPRLGIVGACAFSCVTLVTALSSGPTGFESLAWLVSVPFLVLFTAGRRWGLTIFGITFVTYSVCTALHYSGIWPTTDQIDRSLALELTDHVGPLLLIFVMGLAYQSARDRTHLRLNSANQALRTEVLNHTGTKQALEEAHAALIQNARLAGRAEVAAGVLHNMGNAVNSVTVSSALIADRLNQSRTRERVAQLVKALEDSDTPQLAAYASAISKVLEREQREFTQENARVQAGLSHITTVIIAHQTHTGVVGIVSEVSPNDLVTTAIEQSSAVLKQHGARVIVDSAELDPLITERHRVVDILVGLLTNAAEALHNTDGERLITLQMQWNEDNTLAISISDTGPGIPSPSATQIFESGFTTKPNRLGFGLHIGAMTAAELGGRLELEPSAIGARFTLTIPRVNPSATGRTDVDSNAPSRG